jgi:nucleoside-diphosphate-sugar epimerase/ferritin-like metal-binding protein YciE
VVVTGATGSVGTSVIEALLERDEVEEVVGLARRRPGWQPAKTRWVSADVVGSELEPVFEQADAVIHLDWAIQPSHDLRTLERINVDGSRRVFEAVAATGVPKLICASSVGAYSPGPKGHLVGEDWPVGGIESSFYSRHRALVEEQLDRFEAQVPETNVVRLRPALIFKGDAAIELRRLFAGTFLPDFLVRSGLLPAIPRLSGLCFQAVHSSDVGRAYALAATRDVRGPFNLAASPPLGPRDLAASIGASTFPLPASLARRLTDLSWRLRLQPTPPGWLDMALGAPLISSERAARELGWEPRVTAIEALAELLEGIGHGRSHPAPPLRADEGRIVDEAQRKLLAQLADVHSIEEQALVQLRRAPKIAHDERFAEVFEANLEQTEAQERWVRERLEAHGATAAGGRDGIGTTVFASTKPDTPGKLATHAFSYEHMEIAAFERLRHTAEAAGDEATAAMARQIVAQERDMAERLRACFDVAVDASLNGGGRANASAQLDRCLADAHAIERQGLQLLETGSGIVEHEGLRRLFAAHLGQSEEHAQAVRERMEARGVDALRAEDAALRIGGLQVGAFFAAQPETEERLAAFAFAFENLEIAAYELLERLARRAEDGKALGLAERILPEERETARALEAFSR